MRNIFRLITFFGCYLFFALPTYGQAPVTATVQLATPLSPILHNNVSALNIPPKFGVTLLLNDANEFQLPVKMRLTIEGQGIIIKTTPTFVPLPIFLDFGVPRRFSGTFFQDYFNPENLDFQGFDKNEYINNGGRLPEGLYTMCVEVYDFFRDEVPISNTGCQIANLEEHHPANLIAPLDFYKQITFPQSLTFTWQPMHLPSFVSRNELTLYEVTDNFTDDQLITFTAPIYTTTTNTNSLLYGPTEPMLERNKEYMWRVQTTAFTGLEFFKNDGFSQTGRFIYGNKLMSPPIVDGPRGTLRCDAPQSIDIEWHPMHQEDVPVEYLVSIYSKTNPNPISNNTAASVAKPSKTQSLGERIRNLFGGKKDKDASADTDSNPKTSGNNTSSGTNVNDLYLLHRTTTTNTNFEYGPDLPAIACGEDYYVQVQIIQTGEVIGAANTYVEFDNKGMSQLMTFNCDDACFAPTITLAESLSQTEIRLKWEGGLVHEIYKVDYRLLEEGADWVTLETTADSIIISDLKRKSLYEVKVGGACANDGLAYSNSENVQLEAEPNPYYNCGITPDPVNLDNYIPLPALVKDDIIYAGDFEVTVDEVTGGNGVFSGDGHIVVPFFQLAMVKVKFSSIDVNNEYYLSGGHINVTGLGTDILSDDMEDLLGDVVSTMETIDEVLETVEDVLATTGAIIDSSAVVGDYFTNGWTALHGTQAIQNEYPYLPSSAYEDLDGALSCVLLNLGDPSVCEESLLAGIANLTAALDSLYDASVQIGFTKHVDSENPTYGFDSRKDGMADVLAQTFNKVTIAGEDYYVSWKALKSGMPDKVDAAVNGGGTIPSNITFEDNAKTPIPANGETLTLSGTVHNQVNQIYAVERTTNAENEEEIHLAGKINVISYDEKPIDVVMVPVNEAFYPYNTDSFADKLQVIFDQAVVKTNVTFVESIDVPGFSGTLDDVGSGFLSNYTSQMKDIARAYKSEMDNDKYYVFMVAANSNTSKLGYMPKGKSTAFIYNGSHGSEDEYVKTVAHELSHGAFVLKHIFEEHSVPQGSTDNLMDYSSNVEHTHLHKYQWDLMHDPVNHWSLFDDDSEGEYVAAPYLLYKCLAGDFAGSNPYFVDLGNEVIKLSGEFVPIAFVGIEDNYGWQRGAVARIARVLSDGSVEVYAPRTSGDVENKYFLRKPNGGLDRNTFISRNSGLAPEAGITLNNAQKYFVKGGNDCKLKIQTANLADPALDEITIAATCKNCYGESDSGFGDGIYVKNYTDLELDTEAMSMLFSGNNPINDPIAGTRHTYKGYLFLTDGTETQDEIDFITDFNPDGGYEKIWLEVVDGKYFLKTDHGLVADVKSYMDELNAAGNGNFSFSIDGLFNHLGNDLNTITGGLYEFFDFVTKGIKKAKIPEYVYNCDKPDIYNKDFAKVYEYLTFPLYPVRIQLKFIVETITVTQYGSANIDYSLLSSEDMAQVEFAFLCGIWNGAIEIVAGVPQILAFAAGLANSNKRQEFKDLFNKLQGYKNEAGKVGIYYAMKDGFAKQFDPSQPCFFAHNVSEIGLGIVIAFMSGGATATSLVGKSANTIIKVLKKLDDFTGVLISAPLKFLKVGGKTVCNVVSSVNGKVLLEFRDLQFKALIILDNAIARVSIFNYDRVVLVTTPDGQIFKMVDDPNVPNPDGPIFSASATDAIIADALGISADLLSRFRALGFKDHLLDKVLKKYANPPTALQPSAFADLLESTTISNVNKLASDLIKNDAFGNFFMALSPSKVKAYKGLLNAPDWVRLNTSLLGKLSSQPEAFIAKINNFYKNKFQQPAFIRRTPQSPPPYTARTTHPSPTKRVDVEYDEFGFPKFESHSPGADYYAKSENLKGNTVVGVKPHPDNAFANQDFISKYGSENIHILSDTGSPVLLKVEGVWKKYTWHHHQDGQTMMPVLSDVHNFTHHTGGRSMIGEGVHNFFDSPN